MNKISTDLEQSEKLIELGVDIGTADMLWTYDFMVNDINGLNVISNYLKPEENDIPAWSLSALLELMPKDFEDDLEIYYGAFDGRGEYHPVWVCSCMNRVDFGDTSIDAVFNMVCWLLENKKI